MLEIPCAYNLTKHTTPMELSSFSFQFPRLSCCDQDKDATPQNQSQKIEYGEIPHKWTTL